MSLKLPWESGVFGTIFGDEMLSLPSAVDVTPQPSIPDTSAELSEQLAKSSHVAASVKRPADVPLHAAVMTDISDVDALMEEEQLCETAISKWHFIFETTEWSGLMARTSGFVAFGRCLKHRYLQGFVLRHAFCTGVRSIS